MTLSDEQQAFVNHGLGGHARLLAGPGTGKSFTAVAYLEALAKQASPPRCHMITFTRAATKELRSKLNGTAKLTVREPSTAHAFAMSVLMKAEQRGTVRMADDWEKRNLIEELIKLRMEALGHRVKITEVRELTSEMAAGWESLDGSKLELVDRDPTLAAAFLGAWKEAQRCLDFLHVSEVPYLAKQLLEDQDVDVELDVLVVDEYQDLNHAEIEFIRLLSDQLVVIAIGDDDQSIYSWRQAAPEALLRFCEDGAADFPLTICRRCPPEILEPANAVIAAASGRPKKAPLKAVGGSNGSFAQLNFQTSAAEFAGVAAIIESRIAAGVAPNDIAVLVRSSADRFRSELVSVLDKRGVPVANSEWVDDALAEPEVRRILALGRLVDSPDDSLAWMAWLHQTDGIGWSTLYQLYDTALRSGVTFSASLQQQEDAGFPTLSSGAKKRVHDAIIEARSIIQKLEADRGATLDDDGWGAWLIDHADSSKLRDDAQRMFRMVGRELREETDTALASFINQLQPLARDLAEDDSDAVRLMSMARSKGLTVNTAILMAVDNDTVPSPRGLFEEERRILYVAMTRATEYCAITFAQRRSGPTAMVGAAGGRRQRSGFLARVPGIPSPLSGEKYISSL